LIDQPPPSPTPLVRLEELTIVSRGRTILTGVNLEVGTGEWVVLTGPSGSGKTTLLKAAAGLLAPAGGVVSFRGRRLTPDNVLQARREIAFIPQAPFFGSGTVREALLLPFRFKANRHRHPRPEELECALRSVGLSPAILDQRPATLSGGEAQRLSVLRALLLRKTFFLADEITSALDRENRQKVCELVLCPGHTVLSVSHDQEWISRCHRVIRVANGGVTEVFP